MSERRTAENDATYRAVLGLMLENVYISVSNDFIVVEDRAFDAPAPIRAALARLMEEWIDGEATTPTPPALGEVLP